MLVLTRKKDERIRIGDDITVCVVEIRDDKVRLGFEVPKEIPVHREEVYESIQRGETRNAGQTSDLASRVNGTPSSNQHDLRNEFRGYLQTEQYSDACEMLSKHPTFKPNYPDLYTLVRGLGTLITENGRR